jgi:hypothetical protein
MGEILPIGRRPSVAKYAVLLYAPAPGPTECDEDHNEQSADLQRSGQMVAAFALEPSDTATSLRGDLVIDGPFIESKEVVVGFFVLEAPDLDAALEEARRNPILHQGGGVEVRPVQAAVIAS